MKKLKKDLIFISKTLSDLAQNVEDIQQKIDARKKLLKKPKAKPIQNIPGGKTIVTKTAPPTAIDNIFSIIKKSKKGISAKDLMKKTGYERKSISNAIYKLTKQGKIKTVSKGVYVKAQF